MVTELAQTATLGRCKAVGSANPDKPYNGQCRAKARIRLAGRLKGNEFRHRPARKATAGTRVCYAHHEHYYTMNEDTGKLNILIVIEE